MHTDPLSLRSQARKMSEETGKSFDACRSAIMRSRYTPKQNAAIKQKDEIRKAIRVKHGLCPCGRTKPQNRKRCEICTKISQVHFINYQRRKRGFSPELYKNLMIEQDGLCAICNRSETSPSISGKIKALAADHNHKTGQPRGLLCTKHNMLLGFADDDITILKSAIQYLEKWEGGLGTTL